MLAKCIWLLQHESSGQWAKMMQRFHRITDVSRSFLRKMKVPMKVKVFAWLIIAGQQDTYYTAGFGEVKVCVVPQGCANGDVEINERPCNVVLYLYICSQVARFNLARYLGTYQYVWPIQLLMSRGKTEWDCRLGC